jgi:hypothetical protein
MSVASDVREVLVQVGQGTVEEIAAMLGIQPGDTGYHTVGQALAAGMKQGWAERVGRAKYAWVSNGSRPASKVATPAELQPLIDRIGDDAFDGVGLTYVARTQDGAFICTDQHGVAWRIEVTATARLI